MFAKFDYFDRLEQPILVLCNPNDVELATIQNIDEFNLSVNFNAVSELSLTISKEPANPAYDLILLKRQILVKDVRNIEGEYTSEDLGYFIITDFDEIDGENGKAKTITATSCEIELNNLEVPYIPQSAVVDDETIEFAGTYYLYSTSEKHRSLLDIIMPAAPAWDFNVPTPVLADLQRTFDENLDGTLYNFLMNKLAETYECIVEFDILNRIISFIPKQSALTQTSVFLSRSNFLNEVSLKESGSEYANCISVSGGDEEVSIGRVNPLGNGLLFDFSYDISQGLLSDELVAGLGLWKSKFEEQEPLYILAQRAYIDALEALTVASTAKDDTMIVLRSAEESNRIADFGNSAALKSEANGRLSDAQGYYATALSTYNAAVITLNNKISDIINIQNLVQFDAFLDEDQLIELSRIVKMATYKDEFIIVTKSMSNDEKLDEMVILYDKTKRLLQGGVLEGICEPRREITVNCEGFAFNQAFTHYGAQLQTGCLIDIEQPNEEITSYILQKIGINYSEKTMDLTFGNRYRISNPSSVFGDLYSNTSSMASIVASNYIEWGANIARVNELEIEREAAIQLNAQRVINSVNQRQEFSPNGSFFLSTNPLTGEPTEYGISIADGTMMFFTEYSKDEETGDIDYVGQMAVGRTVDGNGVDSFGFIGDTIVAGTITTDKLVAGSISKGTNLIINGSFENTATFPSSGTNWKSNFTSSSIISSAGFDGYQFYRGFWNNNSSYAGVYLWNYGSSSLYDIPVVEYADYTFSYYYKASFSSSSTPYTNATIKFYNSGGTLISTTNMVKTIVSGGGWERNSKRVKAPQYAAIVRIEIIGGNFSGTGAYIDFDGIMLEQSAFLNDFSAYVGDFVSRYTVINDEGIKVLNGKIQILNDANEVVFRADDDGNLEITGKITAKSGEIGGYTISPRSLYSDYSSATFARAGLQANQGTAADIAIFAGSNSLNSTPIEVGGGESNCQSLGVISSFASAGTGITRATCTENHGFPTGTTTNVIIQGTTSYNGTYTITRVSDTQFTFAKAYVSTQTGTWVRNPNFYVNYNGFLHAENANIVGNITATTGNIGGWTVDNNKLYSKLGSNYFILDNTAGTAAIAIGSATGINDYTGAEFRVDKDGSLHAVDATIEGSVTASSGEIGGWTISSNMLKSGSASKYAFMQKYDADNTAAFAVAYYNGSTTTFPFYVTYNGSLVSTDADVRGTITSTSGTIGGWTLADNAIYHEGSGAGAYETLAIANSSSNNFRIVAGAYSAADYSGYKFAVMKNGDLYASNATIKGTLQADTIIGAWRVNAGGITYNSSNYLGSGGKVKSNQCDFNGGTIAGWTIETDGISYDGAQYNADLRRTLVSFSDQTNGYLSRLSSTEFYMEKFDASYPYTTRQHTSISQNSIELTNSSGDKFEIYVNGSGDLCANKALGGGGTEIILASS